eukprot:1195575-Prorocentrum_minimum.AAC.1
MGPSGAKRGQAGPIFNIFKRIVENHGLSGLLRWAVGRRSRPTGGGQITRVIWLDRPRRLEFAGDPGGVCWLLGL